MRAVGRYTAMGGPGAEARVAAAVEAIGEVARKTLHSREVRALVLIGGYGRGEGGVEVRDGVERPHNNLDVLVITRRAGRARTEALRRRLSEALEDLSREHGIGMDVGAVPDWVLRTDVCRVMWYEMRFGHRTIWGDESFVPGLARFTADRLHPPDLRDLVVNRGTLLVINDAMAELPELPEESRRAFRRHLVKGVIGIGDGLLWALGAYHWSYLEKRRRMAVLPGVPGPLRDLYDRAMAYRFRADPAIFPDGDLAAVQQETREVLAESHRLFESRRLGVPLPDWRNYLALALPREVDSGWTRPREAARQGLALARTIRGRSDLGRAPRGFGPAASLRWALCPPRQRLALVFPAVAWQVQDEPFASQVREVLGATGEAGLRRAFLGAFGRIGDPNFFQAAARLAIPLDQEAG
ncbi:hypothetical protein KBD49_09000 [Myxococcota bacterium]|nr:hypothetical protein [Myxococcota bacterium]